MRQEAIPIICGKLIPCYDSIVASLHCTIDPTDNVVHAEAIFMVLNFVIILAFFVVTPFSGSQDISAFVLSENVYLVQEDELTSLID